MGEHNEGSQKDSNYPEKVGNTAAPTKSNQTSTTGAVEMPRSGQVGTPPASGAGTGTVRPDQDGQRGGLAGGKNKDQGREAEGDKE